MKITPCAWLILLMSVLPAKAANSPETDFRRGTELMEAKQYVEAISLFTKVREALPRNVAVNSNLGIAFAELGRHEEAKACWELLCEVDPTNWHFASKIVQAWQALGKIGERDEAINDVLARRKLSKDQQLGRMPWFCREQFDLEGQRVMGVQYFEPDPERAVYFAFLFLDTSGDEKFRISLGSYEPTTEIARATKGIGANERLYHIDYYSRSEHRTYGFHKRKFEYDEFRELVMGILRDNAAPLSGVTYPTNK